MRQCGVCIVSLPSSSTAVTCTMQRQRHVGIDFLIDQAIGAHMRCLRKDGRMNVARSPVSGPWD